MHPTKDTADAARAGALIEQFLPALRAGQDEAHFVVLGALREGSIDYQTALLHAIFDEVSAGRNARASVGTISTATRDAIAKFVGQMRRMSGIEAHEVGLLLAQQLLPGLQVGQLDYIDCATRLLLHGTGPFRHGFLGHVFGALAPAGADTPVAATTH